MEASVLQKLLFGRAFFRAEEQPDGSLVVEFELKINWELRRKTASFGPNATVLGPPRLVDDLCAFFEKGLRESGDSRVFRSIFE